MMVDHGTFLVSTTYLTEAMAIERAAPELQKKAAEVFPQAQAMLPKAIAAGVKIACGTDAPAIPHGQNAKELVALVDRGMTPMQALRAATVTSAELIEMDDELGRLAAGYLADIIAVPGDPSRGHHHDTGRAVRDEGRPHLQGWLSTRRDASRS